MRLTGAIIVTVAFAMLAQTGSASAATPNRSSPKDRAVRAKKLVIAYEGRLQDAEARPVGGIFPLTFSLYRNEKSRRADWSESFFVAVDNGRYTVELGSSRPIDRRIKLEDAYVGVALAGGEEIVREKLETSSAAPALERPTGPTTTAPPPRTRTKDGRLVVDYAESAGLAYEAEHAKQADKIGNLTAKELLERLDKKGGKGKLGTKRQLSAEAGGPNGTPFEINCPSGTVVTGVRGRGGLYLDAIRLVCQPID